MTMESLPPQTQREKPLLSPEIAKQVETALMGLVKLLKARRFYPAEHPALKATAVEAAQGFVPYLQKEERLTLVIRKEAFLLNDQPVARENSVLRQLATHCFIRRIPRLTFLPELNEEDLMTLMGILALEAAELQRQGGAAEVLAAARVENVWASELEMAEILKRKQQMSQGESLTSEAPPETAPQESAPSTAADSDAKNREAMRARGLSAILADLRRASELEQYRRLLNELMPVAVLALTGTDAYDALAALQILHQHANSKGTRSTEARNALTEILAGDEAITALVGLLVNRETLADQRPVVFDLLIERGEDAAQALTTQLIDEEEARVRKLLAEALVQIGQAALPALHALLLDQPWYVVRNAVAIVGEIRDPSSVTPLCTVTMHADVRVRRETVRALTRIGGREASDALLATLQNDDAELRPQLLLALGATKTVEAVPLLLSQLLRSDPWHKRFEDRKALIKALGEIGDEEAVEPLLKLLATKRWWGRSRHNELRAAAALALGEIGQQQAFEGLEAACSDHSPSVARAASQAVRILRKRTRNGA
ncbi:MAG: hypothetical protein C0621_01385 [Desulfuromonas sp.]|nr:MAG: hypothetical protein C0621_01385 [Desulfuromonas sp.]